MRDAELMSLLEQRCRALRRQQSEANFVTMRRQGHDALGGINLPLDLSDGYLIADDPSPFWLQ
jgi:hypothetical protein